MYKICALNGETRRYYNINLDLSVHGGVRDILCSLGKSYEKPSSQESLTALIKHIEDTLNHKSTDLSEDTFNLSLVLTFDTRHITKFKNDPTATKIECRVWTQGPAALFSGTNDPKYVKHCYLDIERLTLSDRFPNGIKERP